MIKHGLAHYRVGQTTFFSKTKALMEATKTGVHPTWHFADEVFSAIDWQKEVTEDIRVTYQRRAKQLRDKYDHIVLSYSGGSDSWTILNSFLTAGLTVDEILVRWPIKGSSNIYSPTLDQSAGNYLSEWDLVIKHDLNWISSHYPNIKITIDDWSDTLDAELTEDDWYGVNDHLNPGVFKKHTALKGTEKDIIMLDRGKKVATIWGIDKPQVVFKDGRLYTYFLDKLVNTSFVHGTGNRVPELFYWSADFTDIVQIQAQLMYKYFRDNPHKLDLIDWDKRLIDTQKKKTEYNALSRDIVYPDWNAKKFQVIKPTSTVWCEYDNWMFNHLGHTRYMQSWLHGLESLKNAVEPKYHQTSINGKFNGWVGFISPFYDLGPVYKLDNT